MPRCIKLGQEDIPETPAETDKASDEAYEEKLAEYDFQHIDVEVMPPGEYAYTGAD